MFTLLNPGDTELSAAYSSTPYCGGCHFTGNCDFVPACKWDGCGSYDNAPACNVQKFPQCKCS